MTKNKHTKKRLRDIVGMNEDEVLGRMLLTEDRIIRNDLVSFRCPNVLKKRLADYGDSNDLRVSQVVRIACVKLLREAGQTS